MHNRILIIEDHPLMRNALHALAGELTAPESVDTAATLEEALHKLATEPPFDLALFDLRLPDTVGYDGLKTLLSRFPDCTTVVVSGEVDGRAILHCLELGAAGYIPKTLAPDSLRNALRVVADGDIYVPQQALNPPPAAATPAGHASVTDPRSLGLTERQIEVLRLILRGLSNKLICRQLNLSEGTVKVHVSAVLRSLGVHSRAQAIIAADSLGLKLRDQDDDLRPPRFRGSH